MRRRFLFFFLVFGLLPVSDLAGQEAVVRRIAAVSTIAIDEYSLGVFNGAVVNQDEYDEASLFLAEVSGAARGLENEDIRRIAVAYVDSLSNGVTGLSDATVLSQMLDRFRSELESVAGFALDQFPDAAPSIRAGETLYAEQCAECHGVLGGGDGPQAEFLDPAPANLADFTALSSTTPLDFYRFIAVGVAGTAMPSFEDVLTDEQRWALALYSATLRSSGSTNDGREFLRESCENCEVEFSGIEATAGLSDDSLASIIAARTGISVADERMPDAVAYARIAASVEELGADRLMAFQRVIGRTVAGVTDAANLAVSGDVDAASQKVFDSYLVFEEVESTVRAVAPAAATDIEAGFADLRAALVSGDPELISSRLSELEVSLGNTVGVVASTSDGRVLFGKSLLIILREGMEAILIIGALMAFLVKAGAEERKKDIGWGVGAAVFASLGTAFLFATVFSRALESQELIEGLTMLVAAAVLFWVSYWLVSKIEMKRWQAFVRNQMGRALGSTSRLALVFVAFLAVYREGFETVLFYAALYSSAEGSSAGLVGVTTGMLVGFALLAVIYAAIQKFGVKIPLKPFFGATSALLYLMAFSFVGQGIAELQASGSVAITPLSWVPTVPMLGIFPTMQTITFQSLMALAVLLALAWVFWLSPRYAAESAS